jgi:hypothetical protein
MKGGYTAHLPVLKGGRQRHHDKHCRKAKFSANSGRSLFTENLSLSLLHVIYMI